MTNKEMLTIIINGGEITDSVKAKASEMLAALDKKNTKRSEKSNTNRTANIEIAKAIIAAMNGRTCAASEIVMLMNGEYTTAKVTAVMKAAADEGLVTVIDGYKVGGKGRAVKGYAATADDTAED